MGSTTTTFARTGPVYEPLTDAEVSDQIDLAERSTNPTVRHHALVRLGRAGLFAPPEWRPAALDPLLTTAKYDAPHVVPASEQVSCFDPVAEQAARATQGLDEAKYEAERRTLGKCTPPRERHRYSPGGACLHCPARDPRKPLPKPSLADMLKDHPIGKSLLQAVGVPVESPSEPDAVALPVPAPDSPQAGAVEEPETSAVPAIPPPAEGLKAEAMPITTAVSFAEAMGELEAVLSPNLSGDDGYAAWVVGKILDRQAQIQRVEAQAREMVAQLHNDLSGLAYRFKAPLQEYARRLIESSGRKGQRSVKTLSGTLGFRGGEDCKPTLSIADPERLREWCLEQPDAEQFGAYTFVPDKQKVLAWAKATGEVPRGVEAKAQAEAFYVKSADGVSVNLSKLSAPALPAPDEPEEE